MKFYRPAEFRPITSRLKPEEFLKDMVEWGELEEITGVYSKDCSRLCHNAIMWAFKKILNDTKLRNYLFCFQVAVGNFGGFEHSWLVAGNFNLDLTLAQFVEDAPPIAITKVEEVTEYEPDEILSFGDWRLRTEQR